MVKRFELPKPEPSVPTEILGEMLDDATMQMMVAGHLESKIETVEGLVAKNHELFVTIEDENGDIHDIVGSDIARVQLDEEHKNKALVHIKEHAKGYAGAAAVAVFIGAIITAKVRQRPKS